MAVEIGRGSPSGAPESALDQKYRTLVETTDLGYVVLDIDGRAIDANRAYLQLTGRSTLEEILGCRVTEWTAPHDLARNAEAVQKCFEQGLVRNLEIDYVNPAGGFTTVEINATVMQTPQGSQILTLCRNVTDRKRAQDALMESEARFRTIFEQATIGMVIVSLEGRFLQVNPAFQRFVGYTEAELLLLKFSEITHPDYVQKDLESIRACITGEVSDYSAEKRYLQKDGQPIWGRVHVKLVRDEAGNPRNLIALVEDITERKRHEEERHRLEAEVQHAQQLESLGSLAGGVAHDMNNVLQAIQGMASVMKMKFAQEPALISGLEIILNASDRGRNLVRNLTDFARKGLQEPSPLDLNQIVRKEVELLEHTTLQRIELQVELGAPLPPILGEPSSISNALMNLCVNALDAMPGKGVLRFRTRKLANGFVELLVEDTGQGMPSDVLARATEPFFTTKAVGKGTGLGLSSVYGTMKAHGGSMEILSEEGKGTQVILHFVAAEETPAPVASPDSSPAIQRPPKTLKILLIDDDELIRATFPDLMEILGHRVVSTAWNGLDGIRSIEAGLEVDVVVLDHNMPGLSGLETLVRLKVLRPELPIVFCTGHLDGAVKDRLQECTRVWTLMKPYSVQDIRPILSEVSQG